MTNRVLTHIGRESAPHTRLGDWAAGTALDRQRMRLLVSANVDRRPPDRG